jgi:hypothetical protein
MIITINGTDRAALLEETRKAYTALHTAMGLLIRMTINGRDYQGAPAGDLARDRDARVDQYRKLQEVERYLMARYEEIEKS